VVLPRKLRDVVLAVAILGIPLVLLQAGLKSPETLNPLDRILLRGIAPMQSMITDTMTGLHLWWRRYLYLVGVQEENEALRRENMRLKNSLRMAGRDRQRITHYERLLDFRKQRGVERVIGRDASPFVRSLRVRVDRGKEVLRKGLPVVVADGVVGRISRVYGVYSDVRLAADPKSAIDVVVQRTGARGMLRGLDGTNRYACRIDYLLRKEKVKVGDLVVTSGVAGVFPKDVPVGRISRVTRRTYGLYQEVEVSPVVDLTALKEMLVILSPPPPSAPAVDGRTPARGFMP